jgi:uncharacterized membrane protein
MKSPYLAVVALTGAIFLFAIPSPVSAAGTPLTICNQTTADLTVAAGYHSPGANDTSDSRVLTGPFVSHGWLVVAPGKCTTEENPFNARFMFWFGVNHIGLNTGILFWDTNGDHFCVPNIISGNIPSGAFTFEDENASKEACEKGHFSQNGPNWWVNVRSVDVMVNPTVNFTGE